MYHNHKKAVPVRYNGKSQSLYLWSQEVGIDYTVLWQRIKKLKWSLDRVFTEPVKPRQMISFRGETLCLNAWAKKLGIPQPILYQMINKFGCDVEKVFTEALEKKKDKK